MALLDSLLDNVDLNGTNLTEIDNDYLQHQIYNEVRRNNSNIETWRHLFGVFGSLISVFGIIGNILSIIILLKPSSSNDKLTKFLNERNQTQKRRRTLGSFEYKLASFYAYLTALSFCDLFSCIFSILNMLEYIPPPYMDINLMKYREFCLSISLYTHPIATTLQALSVWIICAFSIHRCRSIIKPSNFLTSIKSSAANNNKTPGGGSNAESSVWKTCFKKLFGLGKKAEDGSRNYFCHLNLKNNCNHHTYQLKFYTKTLNYLRLKCCLYCFCTFTRDYESTPAHNESKRPTYDAIVSITDPSDQPSADSTTTSTHKNVIIEPSKFVRRQSQVVKTSNKLNKARLVIFVLYLMAFIYLLPQMFEKKLSYMDIHHKTYVFTVITPFGRTRLFRQIFHLWFYLLAIYILPFVLVLVFNLLLLRTYLKSKKRCQRYKLRADPNRILRDYNSNGATEDSRLSVNTINTININKVPKASSFSNFSDTTSKDVSSFQRIQNFRRRSSAKLASMKLDPKGRALTLTLFGVVAIFFICHFPAAIAKVIYVLYPRVEFEQKSQFASICLDISNFLIMVNSSINFLLYIVFGPGKFRQEFSILFFRLFGCCFKKLANVNNATSNDEYYFSSSSNRGKKCSITNSENNFNLNTSRFTNSIYEANEKVENGAGNGNSNGSGSGNANGSVVEEQNV